MVHSISKLSRQHEKNTLAVAIVLIGLYGLYTVLPPLDNRLPSLKTESEMAQQLKAKLAELDILHARMMEEERESKERAAKERSLKELQRDVDQLEGRLEVLEDQETGLRESMVANRALLAKMDRDMAQAKDRNRAWLVVGIPSFARPNNLNYLRKTLDSIFDQLPRDKHDPFFGDILVVVMNNYGEGHRAFDDARALYAPPDPRANHVLFVDNDMSLKDPVINEPGDQGNRNIPGIRVRKQTRDLVALLRASQGLGQYYLFLEDDMVFCPYSFLAIHYLLSKAERYNPDWLAVRASYGMNGIFIRDKDIEAFADYLLEHQARRPPDHLVVEWFAGETDQSSRYKAGRAHVGFKYNLFNHIGEVSSLRPEKQTAFPICYEALTEPVLFETEVYKPNICPNDDIWPCHPPNGVNVLPTIPWGNFFNAEEKERQMRAARRP